MEITGRILRTIHSGLLPNLWRHPRHPNDEQPSRFWPVAVFNSSFKRTNFGFQIHLFQGSWIGFCTHLSYKGTCGPYSRKRSRYSRSVVMVVLKWCTSLDRHHVSCEVNELLQGHEIYQGQSHTKDAFEIARCVIPGAFNSRCVPYVPRRTFARVTSTPQRSQTVTRIVCISHYSLL